MRAIIPVLLTAVLLVPAALPAEGQGHAWGRQCDAGAVPILNEQMSGFDGPEVRFIQEEGEWCGFWEQVYSRVYPPPPCDTSLVDFDTEVVLAIAIGDRPDSCYGVRIPCVQALGESGNVRAHAVETVPGEGCNCLPVVVQPVEAIKMPRPVDKVQFRQEIMMLECP